MQIWCANGYFSFSNLRILVLTRRKPKKVLSIYDSFFSIMFWHDRETWGRCKLQY
jgi:hypothetical protein